MRASTGNARMCVGTGDSYVVYYTGFGEFSIMVNV